MTTRRNVTSHILLFWALTSLVLLDRSLAREANFGFVGLEPYDQFGFVVASNGDVDGDGIDDVVIGVPVSQQVRVYSGADRSELGAAAAETSLPGFGRQVVFVGDTDGDGRDEFAVSSYGTVNFYYYSPLGNFNLFASVFDPFRPSFGSVIGLGRDLNSDGRNELVISAPEEGYVEVRSIRDVRIYQHLESSEESFGEVVGSIRDWDGDGFAEIVVGMPRFGPDGALRIYSGFDFSLIKEIVGGHYMGNSFLEVDDVDGDGLKDLLVAAKQASAGNGCRPGAGQVALYSSRSPHDEIYRACGGEEITGVSEFGTALTLLGDYNGDGQLNFAASDVVTQKVYIMNLSDGSVVEAIGPFEGFETGLWASFGISLSSADMNGDGVLDLLVGAPGNLLDPPPAENRMGVVYGYYSAPAAPRFLRGDCDGSGAIEGGVNDAVSNFRFCFSGTVTPPCVEACDGDGDGNPCTGVNDGILILFYLFRGGAPLSPPFPECGTVAREVDCAAPPETCQ